MTHSSSVQRTLEDLGASLQSVGFDFRPAAYFTDNGILVFQKSTAGNVLDKTVFLYRMDDDWSARVTQHGGEHWVRVVPGIPDLEAAAVEALRTHQVPPTAAWQRV